MIKLGRGRIITFSCAGSTKGCTTFIVHDLAEYIGLGRQSGFDSETGNLVILVGT